MGAEIVNARIESTMLGNEDHGIPTCYLTCRFGCATQGFGGYDLRHYGLTFITEVLRVVGVSQWEDLRGKVVRIKRSDGLIRAIGNIIEDVWYEPEKKP